MLWVALHLPHLSLEAWAATLPPEAAGRPLALLHGHQVVLPDARARAAGVRPGMKRATAQALAPTLLLGQAEPRRDAEALRAVARVALAFSPSVAWATPTGWAPTPADIAEAGGAPQPAPSPVLVGVRLEVQSCLRYFGGLPKLLDRLRDALAPLGHRVRLASAPTALGAALLAAGRVDQALGPQARFGPEGLAALQPLLDAVPLPWLGLDAARTEALQAMGLATLADLARLPRDGLARRLGPELLDRLDRARGHAPEAQAWLSLPARFHSRLELMARADTSAQVLAGARVLLVRLVAWAGAQQTRIGRFTLVMHHEPRHRPDSDTPERTPLEIAPAQPSADAEHLLGLLTERLGRLPLAAPALELSLQCDALVAGAPPNGELFVSRRSQQEGLVRLVERLQARLGREQVQQLSAVADHRPEHGTRWQPAAPEALAREGPGVSAGGGRRSGPGGARAGAGRAAGAGAGAKPGSGLGAGAGAGAGPSVGTREGAGAAVGAEGLPAAPAALPPQPVWLLPEPQPLAERGQRPLLHGQPLQLLAGPERLETGWWDDQLALRDYFIAQAAGGALVWVFRRRTPTGEGEAGWFLQGLFG